MRSRIALTVTMVLAALLLPVPASQAASSGFTRILLTSTASPATSQYVSWSRSRAKSGQRVVTVAPDGTVRTTPAVRKLGTTKRTAGSTQYRYVARVTGLRPSTRYRYRIIAGSSLSGWRTFRTAPSANEPATLLSFGDTQVANAGVPEAMIDRAVKRLPDATALLQAGDVVNKPWVGREWSDLHRALTPAGQARSVVSSIGNHEQCRVPGSCRSGGGRGFRSYFQGASNGVEKQRRTWFRVDHGPARIIVLDSFGSDLARQRAFLIDSLRTNPRAWSIVLMHRGPFAARGDRDNAEMRRWFLGPLEKYGADLVLSGHDHSYARATKAGVTYVTSVSGPKYYDTSSSDFRRGGATRVRWAERTSTYQALRITPTSLTVRALVGHKAKGASTRVGVGGTLDVVTLRR